MNASTAPHTPLPTDRPLRILIGTKEIGGQIPDYAAGFRALGHHVTTVVRERNRLFPELTYDVELGAGDESATVMRLMQEHDVFVFQYGYTLLPGHLDLPMLRAAGKAIIAVCNGDDIRHATAYEQEFGVAVASMGDEYVHDPLVRPMQTLRVLERFASLIVSVPNQSGLALRPYMHFAYAMDMSLYTENIPGRDVPVVVHAPSSRSVKGTAQILASLDRLAARGVAFELRLIENQPNAVVRDTLRDADVAIDQLFVTYGKFAAEALASGCVVANCAYPDIEPFAGLRPQHTLRVDSLDADLERLLTDADLRRSLAGQGRAHVERYHDRKEVCARMLRALSASIEGTLRYDYYPSFAAASYALPPRTELPQHQRVLATEIIAAHGLPDSVTLESVVRKGLADARLPDGIDSVPAWAASSGLESDGTDPTRIASRYKAFRVPRRPARTVAVQGDAVLARFHALVATNRDDHGLPAGIGDALRLGLPQYALPTVEATARASGAPADAARRAAGLLQLGTGNAAEAIEILAPLAHGEHDADGILSYYLGVAHALLGHADQARTIWLDAVKRLPRRPELLVWGSTPIISNQYWAAAMRSTGADCRTIMGEFYGTINRRSDYDHYFGDFSPSWTSSGHQVALAPYHAFLFVLLGARVLHTSYDGGPLGWTPYAPFEPELLRAADVRVVVLGYGGDCTVYGSVQDPSLRHAFLASYPAAARNEPRIRDRLDRWNAHADCVVSTGHSIDGHGRWDVLIPMPFHIDTERWRPVERYSANDGRNGPVRVIHTPNHRGFKGTEFVIAAVEQLRAEGLQVELDLVEGVQNEEVRLRMQRADILAEQFIFPLYALSGIEGMASGLPTMANLTVENSTRVFRRFSFLDECPVLGTSIETLVPSLRRLVTDPSLRESLGRAGRAYVEKYHSYEAARGMYGAIHHALDDVKSGVRLIDLYHPLLGVHRAAPRVLHPLAESRLRD